MKKLLTLILTMFITATLIGCATIENPNEDYCLVGQNDDYFVCEKRLTSYFDTTISLKLYYDTNDDYDVSMVFDYFEETIELYHQYFDKYHEYESINNVYTINHSTEPVELDQELFDAIDYVLDQEHIITVNDKSLFNIALNPVLEIWHNARESSECDTTKELGVSYCPVPREEIDDIVFPTDPSKIVLDSESNTISFLEPGMSIDLGGYAKGYVSNIIAKHLDEMGVTYLLNTGNSNVVAGGQQPVNDDGLFYIALTKPETDFHVATEYYLYLKIPEKMAVVTSGNYQRYFKGLDDELVYHHIIDPNTNYPGGYCMSITVIYPDSALADILSTAIYLMPIADALDFVNAMDGLEAVWYNNDGTVEHSEGFQQYIFEL
ncbi:MAG: FAD:protein FMN transferase [Bacilli bacterium]|nr:FAD:protein FMN transferase [Bacilli bacterium]